MTHSGRPLWVIVSGRSRPAHRVHDIAEGTGGGVLFRTGPGTYADPRGNPVQIGPGMQVTGYTQWRPDDAGGSDRGTSGEDSSSSSDEDLPGGEDGPGSPGGSESSGLFVRRPRRGQPRAARRPAALGTSSSEDSSSSSDPDLPGGGDDLGLFGGEDDLGLMGGEDHPASPSEEAGPVSGLQERAELADQGAPQDEGAAQLQELAERANRELARQDQSRRDERPALPGFQELLREASPEQDGQDQGHQDETGTGLPGFQDLLKRLNLEQDGQDQGGRDAPLALPGFHDLLRMASPEQDGQDQGRRDHAPASLESADQELRPAGQDTAKRDETGAGLPGFRDLLRRVNLEPTGQEVRQAADRLEEARQARLREARDQQQAREEQARLAYDRLVEELAIEKMDVPGDGNCFFSSVIMLSGDRLRPFSRGRPPTPQLLRADLVRVVRQDVARAERGEPTVYLHEFFPQVLSGSDPEDALRRVYRSLSDREAWDTDEFDQVVPFALQRWGLAMTLLGTDGPRHLGPPGADLEGYLWYDGSHYTASDSDSEIMPAHLLWNRAELAGLESDLRPPAAGQADPQPQQEAAVYTAAFNLLRGELTELTSDQDALQPGLARRGRQLATAFEQRRAYPLTRDTADRLGGIYAELRDVLARLQAGAPAYDPPEPEAIPAAALRETFQQTMDWVADLLADAAPDIVGPLTEQAADIEVTWTMLYAALPPEPGTDLIPLHEVLTRVTDLRNQLIDIASSAAGSAQADNQASPANPNLTETLRNEHAYGKKALARK
jgi:hypothetical protein